MEESILDGLSDRASKIRNVDMYNAEHMLAADMHDEWNYPPSDVKWFQKQFEPYVNLYLDGLSHHIEQRVSPMWEVDSVGKLSEVT